MQHPLLVVILLAVAAAGLLARLANYSGLWTATTRGLTTGPDMAENARRPLSVRLLWALRWSSRRPYGRVQCPPNGRPHHRRRHHRCRHRLLSQRQG